jgi:hypothetical protein
MTSDLEARQPDSKITTQDYGMYKTMVESINKVFVDISTTIDPDDFLGFGLKNSHVYREIFLAILRNNSIDPAISTYIVLCTVAIKSRIRIISALSSPKFASLSWAAKTKKFFEKHTVQYTSEVKGDNSKIAVVHIPSCVPTLACACWKVITPPEMRTVDNFIANLWAAQLRLNDALMVRQKIWEKNFWDNVVKKGSGAYESGFKENYWNTKAGDEYPLMFFDKRFDPNHNKLSETEVQALLE